MRFTLLKTTTARLVVGVAAAAGIALMGMSSHAAPVEMELVAAQTRPADDESRKKIVDIAQQELKNPKRNHETGNNCNAYSPDGKCQAWCADFTKWVWNKAGVKTDGATSAANSFRSYGVKYGTWKSGAGVKKVKPGDAVTYRLNDGDFGNDHVGIVTKVDKKTGRITVISGNSGAGSKKVSKVTIDPKKAQVTGYASPVEKKTGKTKAAEPKKPDTKKSDTKKTAEPKKSDSKKTAEPKKSDTKKTKDGEPGFVEGSQPAQVAIVNGDHLRDAYGFVG